MKALRLARSVALASLLALFCRPAAADVTVTVRVVQSTGAGASGATVKWADGGTWVPVAGTTDGTGTISFPVSNPSYGKVSVSYHQTTVEVPRTPDNYFELQTVDARLMLLDCNGQPLAGGAIQQGGGTWVAVGETNAAGTVPWEAFPGFNLKFRVDLNRTSQTLTRKVDGTSDFVFQTGGLDLGGLYTLNTGAWWSAGPGVVQLLPGTYGLYTYSPRTFLTDFTIVAGECQTYPPGTPEPTDEDAPVVTCETDPAVLSPPDHEMVDVLVRVFAADVDDVTAPEDLLLTATVSSDQADGGGDTTGDTNGADGFTAPVDIRSALTYNAPCWEGTIQLRAETDSPAARVYTVTVTAEDEAGNVSDPATCEITVPPDTVPPTVSCSVDRDELWPANHKMVKVHLAVCADDDVTSPEDLLVLAAVNSSEPDDARGLGDGCTTGDTHGGDGYSAGVDVSDLLSYNETSGCWEGDIQLRAERDGWGDGRAYIIVVVATDDAGNASAEASCEVVVPHDKGKGAKCLQRLRTLFEMWRRCEVGHWLLDRHHGQRPPGNHRNPRRRR